VHATTHQLSIAGQRLTIRSSADAAHLERLAAEVDRRVARAGGQGAPPVGAALLAALGLADELEKARAEMARLRLEVVRRADEMLATLSEAGRR
jgi:cell division protein ZapA (FtsZ GTPase activity inhibitor)